MATERAATPHYIGTASVVSSTAVSGGGFANVYNISSPGGAPTPFVALQVGSSIMVGIKRVINTSGSTWEITTVSNVDAGSVAIHCFAPLGTVGAAESYGLRILGPAGTTFFDTTRKPLVLDQVLAFPGRAPSSTDAAGSNYGALIQSHSFSTAASQPAFCARGAGNSQQLAPVPSPSRFFGGMFRVNAGSFSIHVGPIMWQAVGNFGGGAIVRSQDEVLLVVDMARYL